MCLFHLVFKCKQLNSDSDYLIGIVFNCYDEQTYITATYIHLKNSTWKNEQIRDNNGHDSFSSLIWLPNTYSHSGQ